MELIGKHILLWAFDMALCNRLLRQRYLIWLPTYEEGIWEWKISKKASKVMKEVEQLNAYYRFDYGMANFDLFSNILNDCPKLKNCLCICNLPDHLNSAKRVLIFPNLEKVKFDACQGIHL